VQEQQIISCVVRLGNADLRRRMNRIAKARQFKIRSNRWRGTQHELVMIFDQPAIATYLEGL